MFGARLALRVSGSALIVAAALAWSSKALAREPREWALFDPDLSHRRSGLSLGAMELREWSQNATERGVTFEIWGSLRTRRGVGFTDLRQAVVLRGFEGPGFMLGFSEGVHAGLALGSVELAAGAGLMPIGAEVAHGDFGLDVLSPEASLRLGFEIGRVHISVRGYVQYLARLFGRDDAVIRGLTLDVGFLQQRKPAPARAIEPYYR